MAAVCCCALAAAGCGGGSRYGHPDGFGEATWSAGGELAFVASRHDVGPTAIYVLERDGRSRRVTPPGVDAWSPAWSPDGHWVAYVHGALGNGSLRIVHPDGTGARRLAGPGVDCPRWSPRGSRLAFRVFGAVRVVGVRGGPALAPVSAVADGYSCDYAWSPDGRSLVVARLTTDGGWQLQSVELESFRSHILASLAYDELGPDLEPAWAPAGAIAVGGDELRRVDPSTGSVSLVRAKIGG